MDADQGNDTRAGLVPALNTERVYSTAVPADELARALADHFRAQKFLLGTAYGIWKENQLDQEVWRVIDDRVSAPAQAVP